jgi:chromosome partitioning protein
MVLGVREYWGKSMSALIRNQDPARARSMKTIAVVAQKGGTGKTTVAVNLAVCAHAAGLRAMIADMDPQASSTDWARSRQGDGPAVLPLKLGSLFPAQYTAENSGLDLLIIDTRGGSQVDVVVAAKTADLCLVVVRPTVIDLRAIASTVNLLKPLRRPAAFVINQAPCPRVGRDPVMVMEAVELLMGYGLALAPVALRTRQIYQTAFMKGRSPQEEDAHSLAADELARLWSYTADRLWPAGLRPTARPAAAGANSARRRLDALVRRTPPPLQAPGRPTFPAEEALH